jgi:integrase
VSVTHHASIYSPEGLGELMLAIENYAGEEITAIALDIMPRTITRSKELCFAEWSEIRWSGAEWYIPRERMKMRLPHIVPLSPEVLKQLKRLHALTGHQRYLFPSFQTPAGVMSENTLGKALRIMGYLQGTMTAHGFRTAASTRLNESARWRPDAIERQLAHCEQDSVRAVYNYAQYLPERRKMMVWWSKHLDELRERARARRRLGPSGEVASTQHHLSPNAHTVAAT